MDLPNTPHVLIYVTPWCPYCHRAIALLKKKSAEFAVFDVSADREARRWLLELSGQYTVPQIFIGGQSIGGCDELYALEGAGQLDPLLSR